MLQLFVYSPLILLFVTALFRFSYRLPVLFLDDSVKYFIPLPIVAQKSFSWILDTVNFSFLERVFAYMVQSSNSGDLTGLIDLHKLLGVASTILVYFICLDLSKNKQIISMVLALVFSLNPQLLYIENAVMPESIFVFFAVLSSFLFLKLLKVSSQAWQYVLAVLLSLSLTLTELSKETGSIWIKMIFALLLIFALTKIKETKKYLYIFLIVVSVSFLAKLPIMVYNYDHHKQFTVRRFHTSKGVLLWTLREEFLRGDNPPQKYPWLTTAIKQITLETRKNFGLPADAGDERSFFTAISKINSAGRVGMLVNPETGKQISSKEWSGICQEYWLDFTLRNPLKTIKRILTYSAKNILLEPNLNLHFFKNSENPAVNIVPVVYTVQPFSLVNYTDPALKAYKAHRVNKLQPHDFNVFDSQHKQSPYYGKFLMMQGRGSDRAYAIPEQGLSLWLQSYMKYLPFAYFIMPSFLLFFFLYLRTTLAQFKEYKYDLIKFVQEADANKIYDIYLIGSVLLYALLPILVSSGEPRYRLQFLHFMLFFISSTFNRANTKSDHCHSEPFLVA